MVRAGNEDNLWRRKRERFRTVQQVEQAVRISREIAREIDNRRNRPVRFPEETPRQPHTAE